MPTVFPFVESLSLRKIKHGGVEANFSVLQPKVADFYQTYGPTFNKIQTVQWYYILQQK
jgi:hypothetical protein